MPPSLASFSSPSDPVVHGVQAVGYECIHASNMLQFDLFGRCNFKCHAAIYSLSRRIHECRVAIHPIFKIKGPVLLDIDDTKHL
jgi:hypothetical protein